MNIAPLLDICRQFSAVVTSVTMGYFSRITLKQLTQYKNTIKDHLKATETTYKNTTDVNQSHSHRPLTSLLDNQLNINSIQSRYNLNLTGPDEERSFFQELKNSWNRVYKVINDIYFTKLI